MKSIILLGRIVEVEKASSSSDMEARTPLSLSQKVLESALRRLNHLQLDSLEEEYELIFSKHWREIRQLKRDRKNRNLANNQPSAA